MFKGTTPTHTFEVDMDTSLIKEVKITYSQNDKEVLTKRTEDCTVTEGAISTSLTQEETFLFESGKFVSIQVRILTLAGDALITEPMMMSVAKCLDDEVLI